MSASEAEQLLLFHDYTPESKSNTVELYDSLVLYSMEHARVAPKFLEAHKRIRHRDIRVTIAPAAIKCNGELVNILPGKRESLVEKALRKIAATEREALEVQQTADGGPSVWVNTTIYALRKVLMAHGHSYKTAEIREALQVLVGSKMTIEGDLGVDIVAGRENTLIGDFVWQRQRTGDLAGRFYRISLRLHPLITHSILQKTFRQIDFSKLMRLKSELARAIFVRLSHNYTCANEMDLWSHLLVADKTKGYHLALDTILRETGSSFSQRRYALKAVRHALRELAAIGVLTREHPTNPKPFNGWIEYPKYGGSDRPGRKPLVDVVFYLFPSSSVVSDIIAASSAAKAMQRSTLLHLGA